jgi:6-methylsalicylate decarboxylase
MTPPLSRRVALGTAGAAVASLHVGTSPAADARGSQSARAGQRRIDVHCHYLPEFYRASLEQHDASDGPLPDWSPELAIGFMDTYDIETQVVSITAPALTYLRSRKERVEMARRINDYARSDLIDTTHQSRRGRFGAFAVLPLADPRDPDDVRAASEEAVRAVRELGLDGVGLLSSYGEVYLGDPVLAPLMRTLDALGVVVFVHPVTPAVMPAVGKPALPALLLEFTFDTTRAAVNMSYRHTYSRFRRITWLFAHAGGTLPFVHDRARLGTLVAPDAPDAWDRDFDYGRHLYDTALSWGTEPMGATRGLAGARHILFGSDWPYTDQVWRDGGDQGEQLRETFRTPQSLRRVVRGNALREFPTLAARMP